MAKKANVFTTPRIRGTRRERTRERAAGAARGTGPPRATASGSPRGEAPRIQLEVVADPQRELHLTEPVARTSGPPVVNRLVGVGHIFPVLIEQRPPGPVEVDGKTEGKRFEPDAV